MAEDALTAVALRNDFYQDSQRKSIVALLLAIFINIMLASLLIYLITHPPKPRYFATSINGRITPLFPLDKPNQNDSAVKQWATKAAVAAYTYNFVNYRDELQAASGFFTGRGWVQFLKVLQESNNLEAVKLQKFVVSAIPTRAPIIIKRGILTGILTGSYSWRIQIPLTVFFQNSSNRVAQQTVVVTMLVKRVSTLNTPQGIGISQFVATPASGGDSS